MLLILEIAAGIAVALVALANLAELVALGALLTIALLPAGAVYLTTRSYPARCWPRSSLCF